MLDPRRLQFLREVSARGTITAAAEALSYTPSAVSQQLSALEREVGVSLLERQGRNVALTPAGRELVAHAEHVFAAMERATTAAASVGGDVAGTVRLGAFQSAGATLVPAAIATLHERWPALDLRFTQWTEHGLRELRHGHLDVCVDQEYEFIPHSRHDGLDRELLLTEPVFLAVPARWPGTDVGDFRDRDWVAAGPDHECGALTRAVCQRAGFEPDVRYTTDDLEVSLAFVRAELAVVLLPRLAATRMPGDVRLLAVPDTERRVWALTRPAARDRRAVSVVVNALVEAGQAAGDRIAGDGRRLNGDRSR